MTTLSVVLWQDRHTDPSVHLFTDRATAEDWARTQARNSDRHGDYEENIYGDALVVGYSCEGDSLTVTTADVDAELLGGTP
jgi:hypothetical protein